MDVVGNLMTVLEMLAIDYEFTATAKEEPESSILEVILVFYPGTAKQSHVKFTKEFLGNTVTTINLEKEELATLILEQICYSFWQTAQYIKTK